MDKFQFTPLREGRRQVHHHRRASEDFNSRPSARGDGFEVEVQHRAFHFNSRPSARGDAHSLFTKMHAPQFQFTPLREGRRDARGQRHVRRYFNSRPSARGDTPGTSALHRRPISIHAPPRGATMHGTQGEIARIISIHAPPRGATRRSALCRSNLPSDFNSRPSARGDLTHDWKRPWNQSISIHAPPRGATGQLRAAAPFGRDFNSRPSARGDGRSRLSSVGELKNFNSRPSARGDADKLPRYQIPEFQFTPLREGRRVVGACGSRDAISIHAPPRGATRLPRRMRRTPGNFNSRPSARGDAWSVCCLRGRCDFNSRPSARGDGKRYAISANLLFNPYKSAWLNNSATQFVEIILVIFHRIIA